MAVADILLTKYALDSKDYESGAKAVTGSTAGIATAAKVAGVGLAALVVGIGITAAALAGIARKTVEFAASASKAGAELESVKMGFTAYAAGAAEAEDNLRRLRIVATLPGLGFKEAIEGSTRLQAVGMDARMAERSLMAFGNALALVGGGKDDLEGVNRALSQILSKGTVSAEEINQLAERVPQIRQAMKDAFGTADTEELQKRGIGPQAFVSAIVASLEKLPKATGGAKNAFENLGDSAFVALAKIGEEVNKHLVPALNTLGGFLDYLDKSGVVDTFAKGFGQLFDIDGDALVGVLSYVTAFLEQLPGIMSAVLDGIYKIGRGVIDTVNGFITALNAFLGSGVGKAMGLTPIAPLGMGSTQAFAAVGKYLQDLGPRANEIAKGYKDSMANPSAMPESGPGGFTTTEAMGAGGRQTDLLRQIAENTKPLMDFKRMVLGGGNLGALGVTPVEMAGGRSGRRGERELSKAINKIVFPGMVNLAKGR